MSYVSPYGLGSVFDIQREKILEATRSKIADALAKAREQKLLAATFEAKLAVAEKQAEADLQAQLTKRQEEADLQRRLMEVSPSSRIAPVSVVPPVEAGVFGDSMLPLLLGGGVLLAVLFLKK